MAAPIYRKSETSAQPTSVLGRTDYAKADNPINGLPFYPDTTHQQPIRGIGPRDAHLGNYVLHDLLALRLDRAEVLYGRTSIGDKVDSASAIGNCLLPIEVKGTARPLLLAAAHLSNSRSEDDSTARVGLLPHKGTAFKWLAPDALSALWRKVL